MAFAIELFFDRESDLAVRELWGALLAGGVAPVPPNEGARPHVSLGVAGGVAVAALAEALPQALRAHPPGPLALSSIGLFPTHERVIYLGVVVTEALLRTHRAVYPLLERYGRDPWTYYAPGAWVPHCTLASYVPRERTGAAVEICLRAPLPIRARVEAAGLVEVARGKSTEVAVWPL